MTTRKQKSKSKESSLEGQLLLAMPSMGDRRFRRAVIYMCSHSADGAMGIIVNQRADNVTFSDLLRQLSLSEGATSTDDPLDVPVHVGGPVSTERGFVLHSDDFKIKSASVSVANKVFLTSTIEILRAMANGQGPQQSLLALGYSGWSPGQLDAEIQANAWLHCPAERDLIFGTDLDLKYERALSTLGVDLSHLVSDAGHA